MLNMLLIILPLLIPFTVLGYLFARLFSHQPNKYESIHRTFSYASPSFTHGGQRHIAEPSERAACNPLEEK
jgi:hypothetical protein